MLNEMIDLARDTGRIFAAASAAGGSAVHRKQGIGNFVTDYDLRIQNYLYENLKELQPDASFVCEEGRCEINSGPGTFIVDPIDGTANFINGYGHSAVSIAYAENGQVRCGVVFNPYKDEMFYAGFGEGAFLNGQRIHSRRRPLEEGVVLFGTSSYDRGLTEVTFLLLKKLFEQSLDLRNTGSAALDICYVASGKCDVFFEMMLSPWDYAAGSLILEEAGGVIQRIEGGPVSLKEPGSVLAASAGSYQNCRNLWEIVGEGSERCESISNTGYRDHSGQSRSI